MAFNIKEFKAAINRGVQRSHSYEAIISFSGLNAFGARQLSILCESAEIPGKQFNTTPELMYGVARKMPFGTLYEDLSLTFVCTSDMEERYFFDKWMSYISDPTSNYMGYYDTYKSNIMIRTLSATDQIGYVLFVEEAYPISILPQAVSYGDTDNYLRLTVVFAYRRWRNDVEKRTGDNYSQGHNVKGHITQTTDPGTGFSGDFKAPDELTTQAGYDNRWTSELPGTWTRDGQVDPTIPDVGIQGVNKVPVPASDIVIPNQATDPGLVTSIPGDSFDLSDIIE